jgi:RNA polymerase sigma factor (sigma-70 family)
MTTDAHQPTAAPDRHVRLARCLERAQSGELGALDEIVESLTPLLWHVARAQGLQADDAADVVQTTWLELLRRLNDIRSPQALTAWLVTATRRESWHTSARRRKQAGAGADLLETVPDPGPGLDELLGQSESYQGLAKHFRRLPGRCRELLRIVALVDRPDYTAMSEALGMPVGSIGPTRGRCLAKLRAMLLADPTWSPR